MILTYTAIYAIDRGYIVDILFNVCAQKISIKFVLTVGMARNEDCSIPSAIANRKDCSFQVSK